MIKTYQIPVLLIKNDFAHITYEAKGIANYWDIKSNEFDDPESAIADIKARLEDKFQKEVDTWGEFEVKQEEVDPSDDEQLVSVEIVINTPDEEE